MAYNNAPAIIKAFINGTDLDCLDLSRQFKLVRVTYSFIKMGIKVHGLCSEHYEIA